MSLSRKISNAVILAAIVLSVSFSICFSSGRDKGEEAPDILVHSSTFVAPEQVIGKVIVAGGNAEIAGKVNDGVIVVDGNLIVKSGATILGRIIVLGGSVSIEQGASVEGKPWIIVPQGHPLVPVMIAALFLAAACSRICSWFDVAGLLYFTINVVGKGSHKVI